MGNCWGCEEELTDGYCLDCCVPKAQYELAMYVIRRLCKVVDHPNHDRIGKCRDEEYANAAHRLSSRIRDAAKG